MSKSIFKIIGIILIICGIGLLVSDNLKKCSEIEELQRKVDSLSYENWWKEQQLSSYPKPTGKLSIGGEKKKYTHPVLPLKASNKFLD